MGKSVSVVEELLSALPTVRPQLYFKTSLTALSHAMEDQVLAGSDRPLVIASFQQERFYRQEAHRYQQIAAITDQVYVLSGAGTSFENQPQPYETIAFDDEDALTQEWHLVVLGDYYSACLVCRERQPIAALSRSPGIALDQIRRFEGLWTQDRAITQQAAQLLLARIQDYRSELADKLTKTRDRFLADITSPDVTKFDADPFAQRLVTYLQAGQYKLLKAYKAISDQERRERLVNSITSAMRRSMDPDEIFEIAVHELSQAIQPSRCLIYRCKEDLTAVKIQHEARQPQIDLLQANPSQTNTPQTNNTQVKSLLNQSWPIQTNPLFQQVRTQLGSLVIADTQTPQDNLEASPQALQPWTEPWQIRAWLIVPLVYQERLLGMVELHQCGEPHPWSDHDVALVEAIATQLGVALIQADAYANLEDLNQQLEALERTRSNLIAITGHELRTPLSTIQVCLESLATEPDMPVELQQIMLTSALEDAERMRKLVQDFLTLSRLESGRIEWTLESLSLQECIDLALSSIRAKHSNGEVPTLKSCLAAHMPLVRVDGEWLVEVLTKLLDNACKFTPATGQITLSSLVHSGDPLMVEVIIADTGRGIEPNRLETVFDRFYQEEGALRRTTGGTGLGLAISRQIITGLGGKIWATSAGKDQGSEFHFTLPAVEASVLSHAQTKPPALKAAAGQLRQTAAAKNR